MSTTAVNGLILLITAFLLTSSVVTVVRLPPSRLAFKPEAEQTLNRLEAQFEKELRKEAAGSPRAVKAEYLRRRKPRWKEPRYLATLRRIAGGVTFGLVVFVLAVLALPFLAGPFPVVAGTAGYAGAPLAALGLVVAATKYLNVPDDRPDALRARSDWRRDGSPTGLSGGTAEPMDKELERYRARVDRVVRKSAQSTAASYCRSRTEAITRKEIEDAWRKKFYPPSDVPAASAFRSLAMWIASAVAVLVVAAPIYLIFVLAIPGLSLSAPWRIAVIAGSLLFLYGLMRAIVGAWRRRDALLDSLRRAAFVMVDMARLARPRSRTETDSDMSAQTETNGTAPVAAPAAAPPVAAGDGGERLPARPRFASGWWWAAFVSVVLAAVASVEVVAGTHPTSAHRAEAAGAALLVVLALALVAQAILLWYQARRGIAPGRGMPGQNLAFRRRGLKAAVMGQDGRASTSKTQVVLWTAAVVWALVDLLLLVRAYPGGNLFTHAMTANWRPEYLVLLGLPVAAATAAKATVAGTNAGHGPVASGSADAAAGSLGLDRVYERDPVLDGERGLVAGVAELLTGDDGMVAWADLQYVVFTLLTLVYFAAQFLTRPANGLPPVPAALLTLMGVSATAYTANKIVNTRGIKPSRTDKQPGAAVQA